MKPLGAFALTAAQLATLRNSGIKVPHVVAPKRNLSNWGHALFVADYVGNVVQEFQPWQADITNQRVDFATLVGSPQIKYSIGYGVLQGPVDALVFPAGNR